MKEQRFLTLGNPAPSSHSWTNFSIASLWARKNCDYIFVRVQQDAERHAYLFRYFPQSDNYRKSRRLETYSSFNTNEIKYKNAEIRRNQYVLLRVSLLLGKSCAPRRDDEQKLSWKKKHKYGELYFFRRPLASLKILLLRLILILYRKNLNTWQIKSPLSW